MIHVMKICHVAHSMVTPGIMRAKCHVRDMHEGDEMVTLG